MEYGHAATHPNFAAIDCQSELILPPERFHPNLSAIPPPRELLSGTVYLPDMFQQLSFSSFYLNVKSWANVEKQCRTTIAN